MLTEECKLSRNDVFQVFAVFVLHVYSERKPSTCMVNKGSFGRNLSKLFRVLLIPDIHSRNHVSS